MVNFKNDPNLKGKIFFGFMLAIVLYRIITLL